MRCNWLAHFSLYFFFNNKYIFVSFLVLFLFLYLLFICFLCLLMSSLSLPFLFIYLSLLFICISSNYCLFVFAGCWDPFQVPWDPSTAPSFGISTMFVMLATYCMWCHYAFMLSTHITCMMSSCSISMHMQGRFLPTILTVQPCGGLCFGGC